MVLHQGNKIREISQIRDISQIPWWGIWGFIK